jgi:hypothetical protein
MQRLERATKHEMFSMILKYCKWNKTRRQSSPTFPDLV